MNSLASSDQIIATWIVVILYMAIILFFVIRGALRVKNISDYALGSITFSPLAVGLALAGADLHPRLATQGLQLVMGKQAAAAQGAARVQALQFGQMVGVARGRADVKGVVAMHPVQAARELVMHPLRRVGVGIGVGHLEHGRHAAEHGRARTGLQVLLVLEARLAEMHLTVDHAGQNVQAGAVDDIAGCGGIDRADGRDAAVGDAGTQFVEDQCGDGLGFGG